MEISEKDRQFMQRALSLAARAGGRTSPNPMVGAVIVKDDRILSEDFHKKPGELHAEALAINTAGTQAKDSTLYVTLEPCCHLDKRTPPCTAAIINAGISRVFVAMRDPNPKVAGKGIEALRRHGIEVTEGLMEDKARLLNESYAKFIATRRPFVILKVAMTLDGKIATPDGESKWITGPQARRVVHRMRSSVDAVLTAIGTVKADDPELTARIPRGKNPRRIIIDPCLETPPDFKVFTTPPETIVVARKQQSAEREQKRLLLQDKGIGFVEHDGDRADLGWLMERLGEREITSVLVEGGSSLASSVLHAGIVDKVVFFIAPKIIGGRDSIPAVGGHLFRRLPEAFRVRDMKVRKIGDDLMVEGYIEA
ncbi:MAG: bifunctional diaminohydroxyphosphoribosylaminopyrimidine deaminase/5-amino-6-(5-phosphoribosylamino)uracil reductase RibD [Thermodesulfovibrionales bacterium]|jgi:diaminohydroxyphosphoribosylaminopyrimidine deaminase/5-amino-6-(5-phosphoribosylamino)uracil reductase